MKRNHLAAGGIVLAVAWALLAGLSALAQNNTAPAAPIGPGNTGTIGPAQGAPAAPTKKMLDNALSPETRNTLQDAINSVDPAAVALTANQLDLGPGEGAELDGTTVTRVDFAHLPARLRAALGGKTSGTLTDSTGP